MLEGCASGGGGDQRSGRGGGGEQEVEVHSVVGEV